MKTKGNSRSNSDESSSEDESYVMGEKSQNKNSDHENKEYSASPPASSSRFKEHAVGKKKGSDVDSASDEDNNTSRDEKTHHSKSPHKRSKRSSSRHRRDRSRRSRSGSRHRRRRSGSKERRRRSKSRSRDRHRSPKRSRRDSTRERQRSSDRDRSSRRDSSSIDYKALKKSGSSGRDRHTSRSRSRDRTRARDSRRRSRSRGHRRSSRSRSGDRRRSGRSRSRDRRRRRSKSRSRERRRRRSRSRSHKRLDRSASTSPYRFGFNKAMDAQERLARRLERAKELTKLKKEEEQKKANGFLGLKDDKLKEAIEKAAQMIAGSGPVLATPSDYMSAQASAQMTALRKQAEAETGVAVPTYYNPMVVNPMMFAQQQAKRNKLWSKKETETNPESSKDQTALWSKTSLGDEKSDEKFAKLMGIKQLDAAKSEEEAKKRQELFSHLDMQYEQARVVTHTQRGAGLGFASNNPNTLLAQQANQQLNPASSLPPKT